MSEALRLANRTPSMRGGTWADDAAAELRRLAAVEQELEALKRAISDAEPVADIKISGDDFDIGLTDAFAFGALRLPDGHHLLYTLKGIK